MMIAQIFESGIASASNVNPDWYMYGMMATAVGTLWYALVKRDKEVKKIMVMAMDKFESMNNSNVAAMKEMTKSHDDLRQSTQNLNTSVNMMNVTIQNVQSLLNMEMSSRK